MEALYKTLPEEYVADLLDGAILFRNLVYFITVEADPRTDVYEGRHVDAPDHPVLLLLEDGREISGQLEFHNTVRYPERIFCFCTSTHQTPGIIKFGNACIRIHDPIEFKKRLTAALARRHQLSRLERPFLTARPVDYYATMEAAPVDITNPKQLPFLKRTTYIDEAEFRFVFAKRGGYEGSVREVLQKPLRRLVMVCG